MLCCWWILMSAKQGRRSRGGGGCGARAPPNLKPGGGGVCRPPPPPQLDPGGGGWAPQLCAWNEICVEGYSKICRRFSPKKQQDFFVVSEERKEKSVFQNLLTNRYCIYSKYVYLHIKDVGDGGAVGARAPPNLKPRAEHPQLMHGTKSAPKFIWKFVDFFKKK